MENLKIRVNNERKRVEIQELLFKLGYEWWEYGTQINKRDYVEFIYVKTTKLIFHGANEYEFIKDPSKEVTIKDLKVMVEEKETSDLQNNHIFDAVSYDYKPKHPKVWAWDDEVKIAFETYLIAEFEGMEFGYNYLLVHKLQIEKFENKLPFRTDLYKNISQTNPNQNKEIEAIANRIKEEFEKHPELEWAMIAAHKIYSSHIKESK